MIHFLFDVDGTLTPSRQPIDPQFQSFFQKFVEENKVSLVTGSDLSKTKEQLGCMIPGMVEYCFNCSGNDVYSGPKNVYTNDWTLPKDAEEWLAGFLKESKFVLRTGLHFEHRPGMCNFSIVGRNATLGERKLYVKYDEETNERNKIARMLVERFKYIDAVVGGETGIDIFPRGKDKAQVLSWIKEEQIFFFGDRCEPGGNDYPIANILKRKPGNKVYHVSDWRDTRLILLDSRLTNQQL